MEDGQVGFGWLNYTILSVYLLGMILIGFLCSRKNTSTEQYFLGGRSVPWILVAISIFSSFVSATSYIGIPGIVFAENISFFVGILMMPVVAPFVIWLFLPFYQRLKVTTTYEYLERRFGKPARYTTSVLFLMARLGWLGTVIYAPSLVLAVVTGMDLWLAIVLNGVVGLVYTAVGGMEATIWTDIAQFFILIGGAIGLLIHLYFNIPGGVPAIWEINLAGNHLNLMDWRFSWTEMTVSIVLISYFFTFMHDYGVDQVSVQRLLTIGNLRGMARATILNAFVTIVVLAVLVAIGMGFVAYYAQNPAQLPAGITSDQIMPYYMLHQLPQGVSGLLITGIFAAAMSCVSSALNSLATVTMNDLVTPLRRSTATGAGDLRLAKNLTTAFGFAATGLAFVCIQFEQVMKASMVFLGLFTGPVLGLFLLGILTRRGTFRGWVVGTVIALPVTAVIQALDVVHFLYYFPISFGISLGVGYAMSLLLPAPEADPALTIWGLRRRTEPAMERVGGATEPTPADSAGQV